MSTIATLVVPQLGSHLWWTHDAFAVLAALSAGVGFALVARWRVPRAAQHRRRHSEPS
ncbi:hypothetical protein [Aestuariimicrobium ganziense]|uniref:hypothetical protein n=1 Tax=Aestuariimicrobium ganziense TaxID=2773677 RepID=UPI00194568B1|nr:hypothetical protein [Aestuariimicrobium ganziense]